MAWVLQTITNCAEYVARFDDASKASAREIFPSLWTSVFGNEAIMQPQEDLTFMILALEPVKFDISSDFWTTDFSANASTKTDTASFPFVGRSLPTKA
jgi:hypothetical protein